MLSESGLVEVGVDEDRFLLFLPIGGTGLQRDLAATWQAAGEFLVERIFCGGTLLFRGIGDRYVVGKHTVAVVHGRRLPGAFG